jgi:hypothetical protein
MAGVGAAQVAVRADGVDATEIAVAFAAEFARLGYSGSRILKLFFDSFYVQAHTALRQLGERTIRHIVANAIAESRPLGRPRHAQRRDG